MHRAAEEQGFHVAGLVIGDPRADVGVGHARARIVDDGILPVGTEVTDVSSCRGIHHQDAPIAVAVGDVEAVRLGIDAHVRYELRLRRAVGPAVDFLAVRAFHPAVPIW